MDYLDLADRLTAEIRSGALRAGTRLMAQREFAHRNSIASSTAARVYAELVRRGLVVGEVGRGTFVAGTRPLDVLGEPAFDRIDLAINFPRVDQQSAAVGRSAAGLAKRPDEWAQALGPSKSSGTARLRNAASSMFRRAGFDLDGCDLLFPASGRQAILTVLTALLAPGDRLGVEALTYPFVREAATRLGIRLVPLAMDHEGVTTAAIAAAHEQAPLRAIYIQPTLHNPLGCTLGAERRRQIAETIRNRNIVAVEDAVYRFLDRDLPPLAAYAPDRVVVVDSFSKRIAPGITTGFVIAPMAHVSSMKSAMVSGGWIAGGLAQALAVEWLEGGLVEEIEGERRDDAGKRQSIVRAIFGEDDLRGDPAAYHCWLVLPEGWRSEAFAAAAASSGVAVTPASAFTVSPGHAPGAVRLALASPTFEQLERACVRLKRLLDRREEWPTE